MEEIIKFEKELANFPFDQEWAIKAKKNRLFRCNDWQTYGSLQKKKFMIGV